MQIIAETAQYLVINKPNGLLVEQSPYFPSVEAWAAAHILHQQPRRTPFVGIVHRLDRSVSGILLIAKKKSYLQAFNEQFRLRQVTKQYVALVENQPTKASATLQHFLSIDKKAKKAIITPRKIADAHEVSLSYEVLATNASQSLLSIDLHTGKFHQIRAQLSAIGCPIVGDIKYGANTPFVAEAIALHAKQLTVTDPQTGLALSWQCTASFEGIFA